MAIMMKKQGMSLLLAKGARFLLFGLIAGPVIAGTLGIIVPAFGWFPPLGGVAFSLAPIQAVLDAPGIWQSVWLSLSTALLATGLSYFCVMMFLAVMWQRGGVRWLVRALAPLLSVPHITIAVGLLFLLQPSGWIARLISPALSGWERPPIFGIVPDDYGIALIFGLMVKEIPFLLLMALSGLNQLPAHQWIATSRSLGYGPVSSWCLIVQPNLAPRLLLAVLIVLIFCVSVVDMALILAPTTPPPLSLRVLSWFQDPDLSARFTASAGALFHVILAGVTVCLWLVLRRLCGIILRSVVRFGIRFQLLNISSRPLCFLGVVLVALPCAIGALGLGVSLVWSVAEVWRFPDTLPARWGLSAWSAGSVSLWDAAINTIVVGVSSAAIALCMVIVWCELTPAAYIKGQRKKITEIPFYIPLLVPQIAFLFGLQIMLVWLDLDGLYITLIWAHLLFVFPYVLLSLGPAWRRWDNRLDDVGAALGAGRIERLIRIKLPVLITPIMTSLAIGFAVSAALYLPTIFVGGGRIITLTTEAVTLASGAGRQNLGAATALQMALPLLILLCADAVSRRRLSGTGSA